jgi:hypothetical protein
MSFGPQPTVRYRSIWSSEARLRTDIVSILGVDPRTRYSEDGVGIIKRNRALDSELSLAT